MSELVKDLEHIIWSYLAIPILLFVSLIFTFYFQGVQFRFKKMIQCLTKKSSNSSVSSFQSFTMALAARVGVGSLAGVALGIYIGGPGSVFWMWISALITAAASFVESTLAQLYKKRDGDIYIGGPAYYIEYGMHQKGFAVIKDVLVESFAEIEKLYNQKEPITGVPTGFADLDYKTAGLQSEIQLF